MPPRPLAAVLLALTAAPLVAQEAPAEDRHAVAPDSNWSLTDSDCTLDVGFGKDAYVLLNPHGDHFDLGIYDTRLKGVVDQKVIPIKFAAAGKPIGGRDYQALGHRNKDGTSYVSDVDDALLEAIAAGNALQLYRGKALLADLDMTGFGAALAAMRACAGAQPEPVVGDSAEAAAAAAEAEAAADAAVADAQR